jgi:hypothetical protein
MARNATRSEKAAADSRMDRLNIWMQNVEREFSSEVFMSMRGPF